MAGAIIVSIFGASLVAIYMVVVNRLLRTDEHYHSTTETPATKPAGNDRSFSSKHAHA